MYKDIDINLKRDGYRDVSTKDEADAIKQSVTNIISTVKGELFYFPEFGCNVNRYLHEKATPFTFLAIRDEILFALRNFEPRITDIKCTLYTSKNSKLIIVDVVYRIVSLQEVVSQQLSLRLV